MQLFLALKPFLLVSLMHLCFVSSGIRNVILLHSHMAEIVVKRLSCSWPSWLCRACLFVCSVAVWDFYTNSTTKNCSRQLKQWFVKSEKISTVFVCMFAVFYVASSLLPILLKNIIFRPVFWNFGGGSEFCCLTKHLRSELCPMWTFWGSKLIFSLLSWKMRNTFWIKKKNPHSHRHLMLLYNNSDSRIYHFSLSLLHFRLQLLRCSQVMANMMRRSCHSDHRYW